MSRTSNLLVKRFIDDSDIEIFHNLQYGSFQTKQIEHCNVVDVYRPKNSGQKTLPALIHIHGGGFTIFSKDSHAHIAAKLARMGFVVFNINYRLAPTHPYPHGLEDAATAYKWVIENASKYGADTSALHLMGESAGGNFVLGLTLALYGLADRNTLKILNDIQVKPKFIAPICAFLEPSNTIRYKDDPSVAFWMYERMKIIQAAYIPDSLTAKEPRDWGLVDPLVILEKLEANGAALPKDFPTTFIGVGRKDPVFKDSQRLNTCLKKLNAKVIYHEYLDEGHAFHVFFFRKNAKKFWNDLQNSFKKTQ